VPVNAQHRARSSTPRVSFVIGDQQFKWIAALEDTPAHRRTRTWPIVRGPPQTSWLQDAAIKIGPILMSPMTSSMRDFGVSRSVWRPDVRFCGTVLQLSKRLEPRSDPRRLSA